MAISKTRPNSLFASLAVTEDGSSVSPRLFRNVATRSGLARRRPPTEEPDPVSVDAGCAFTCLFCPICTKQSILEPENSHLGPFDPSAGREDTAQSTRAVVRPTSLQHHG